jgi:hypothetical protein
MQRIQVEFINAVIGCGNTHGLANSLVPYENKPQRLFSENILLKFKYYPQDTNQSLK